MSARHRKAKEAVNAARAAYNLLANLVYQYRKVIADMKARGFDAADVEVCLDRVVDECHKAQELLKQALLHAHSIGTPVRATSTELEWFHFET